jgi:hypothetical protein
MSRRLPRNDYPQQDRLAQAQVTAVETAFARLWAAAFTTREPAVVTLSAIGREKQAR